MNLKSFSSYQVFSSLVFGANFRELIYFSVNQIEKY